MSYQIQFTGQFKKSYKRCIKRGCDQNIFKTAISILSETGALPDMYKPHRLHGNYEGFWECHLQSDWLLVWMQHDQKLVLILTDIGTHSDIFG